MRNDKQPIIRQTDCTGEGELVLEGGEEDIFLIAMVS